ncbi:glycosyl transferase family 1 [Mesorhizobium sp. 1B3]|uniref:glycosyl transferase family 1 n=1 Tax=Mesorhizobium sp. 1B3 TaxID=3243599 RepID=UPI003D9941B4
MLRVLYLVHDVSDPAVGRRVRMLRAGGAEVILAGFRRGAEPVARVDGLAPIELGVTRDGKFAQRIAAVAQAALSASRLLKDIARPDVIVARNLEMLALARRVNAALGGDIPIVYECLDIHRLLLRSDPIGAAMRKAEQFFSRDIGLLVTSSPAFVKHHFRPVLGSALPIELVENKVLELADDTPAALQAPAGPPWRIGWFGALRCRRSLELLSAFSRAAGGKVKVVLRGRPARGELADFDNVVADEPYVEFHGVYRNPDELAAIYGDVHFSWAIDFFEEGQNSQWLLPNRIYEGCRYGVVPIAMRGTETGNFVERLGCGLLLPERSVAALSAMFSTLDPGRYGAEKQRVTSIDPTTWICGIDDCRALVGKLRALTAVRSGPATIEATA